MNGESHRKLRTPLLFRDLASAEEREELLARAETTVYGPRQLIFREGEPSDSLFVILEGCVEIRREHGDVHLDVQHAGEYFGELGVFDDQPRSASATAKVKTTCQMVSQTLLNSWLESHPRVAIALLRHATWRIRDLSAELRSSRTRAYERFVGFLKKQAVKQGDSWVINNMPSNSELAQQFNLSRRHMINITKALREGGYIEVRDRTLILKRDLPPNY